MASLLIPQQLIPPTGTTLAGIRFAEGVDSIAGWTVTGATPTLAGDVVLFDTPAAATVVDTAGSAVTFINAHVCPAITTLDCAAGSLTEMDVSGLTALQSLTCNGQAIAALNVTGCTVLDTVLASANSLDSAAVDSVLIELAAIGNLFGTVELDTNAIPTAAGLAAKTTLEGRGWTVSVDS